MTELKKSIKILHVFDCMYRGGAEMRTLDLMRYIDRERYQFHFCTLSGLPGSLDDEIYALGGKIHPCQLGPSFPWRFRRLLRLHRFDVVHSHLHYFSGFILRLAAKEGTPIRIAHFRNTNDGKGNSLRRRLQRSLMRHWIDQYSTRILAVSQGVMSASWGLQWQLDSRCQVIYNGFDLSAFAGLPDPSKVRREFHLPEECTLYIHVGRMAKQKNHARLLTIFTEITNDEPMARLLVVGWGNNEIEQWVRARAAKLGIVDRVVFTGERSDVPCLLTAADLLIFPSLWEGLPGAVLEACAVGTPVLASDLPGVKEIASQLPLVRYLSLDASDRDWAKAARILCAESSVNGVKGAATQAFAASTFNVRDCAKAHCSVWEGF